MENFIFCAVKWIRHCFPRIKCSKAFVEWPIYRSASDIIMQILNYFVSPHTFRLSFRALGRQCSSYPNAYVILMKIFFRWESIRQITSEGFVGAKCCKSFSQFFQQFQLHMTEYCPLSWTPCSIEKITCSYYVWRKIRTFQKVLLTQKKWF